MDLFVSRGRFQFYKGEPVPFRPVALETSIHTALSGLGLCPRSPHAAGAAQDELCWTEWAALGVCRTLLFATRAAALGFGSCSLLFCAS